MQERRKFVRLGTKDKTTLEKQDGPRQECSLVDISTGGMKIFLDNKLDIGNAIAGQFKILPNSKEFYVKGEVVWVKPSAGASGFEIGIKFNKISSIPI